MATILRLDLLALVADEAAPDVLVPERGDDPLVALHGLPGAVPLRVHRRLKTRLIERETPLGEYLPRHLHREPVSVVQHERDVAGEVPAAQPLYLGEQQRHPGLVDLHEPRRLARDHAPDVLPRRTQLLVEVAHVTRPRRRRARRAAPGSCRGANGPATLLVVLCGEARTRGAGFPVLRRRRSGRPCSWRGRRRCAWRGR